MSSKVTGSSQAFRYRVETEFDPQTGETQIEYWCGPKAAIQSIATGYKLAGFRVRTTHSGPKWEATVRIGVVDPSSGGTGVEVPVDRWNFDTDIAQISIWEHPDVVAAGAAFSGGGSGEFVLEAGYSGFKKGIEDAIKNGEVLPATGSLASSVVAIGVWELLLRDMTSFEIRRPALSKTRTYSDRYADRMVVDVVENIYTTAELVSAMNVPVSVQRQLPTNPTTPPTGWAWGWKFSSDRSETIPALGKIQETRTWVFQLWSVKPASGAAYWGSYKHYA